MKQISLPRAALLALLNTGACEVRKPVANSPAVGPENLIFYERACELFGVSVDIFEQKTIDALADRLAALEMRVKILEAEKAQLSASVALCHVRLDQCEKEKQKLQKQN